MCGFVPVRPAVIFMSKRYFGPLVASVGQSVRVRPVGLAAAARRTGVGRPLVLATLMSILGVPVLQGCAGGVREELPVPLEITLHAAADVNPSVSGRASPVVVRLYELRNAAAFLAADYFTLQRDEAAMLGEELVSRQEYVMAPGETRLVRRRAGLQTRVVAIVAGYRDLENSVWRAVAAVPSPHFAGALWGGSVSPSKRYVIDVGAHRVMVRDEADGREPAAR